MQKWEYCAISGLQGLQTSYPRMYLFTHNGMEIVADFKKRPKGVPERDAVGQLIARLGDEGWEMIGTGNIDEVMHCIYFKRPKS